MVCGVGTEVIAGEGLILTAGGIDAHIHFTCPQLSEEAIASGLTTMVGGGTGKEFSDNLQIKLMVVSLVEERASSSLNLLDLYLSLRLMVIT